LCGIQGGVVDFLPQLHTYVIFHIAIMDMVLLETFVWIETDTAECCSYIMALFSLSTS
jgi:hypothetical protein